MNNRIYPSVSEALINREDLGFDHTMQKILEAILTESVVDELCKERYNALKEVQPSPNFEMSVEQFLKYTDANKSLFKSLILCYASLKIIPVTQSKLGECVELFLERCGKWETKIVTHHEVLGSKKQIQGNFENGKRK